MYTTVRMVAFILSLQVWCINFWSYVTKFNSCFCLVFVLQKWPCWMSPVWSMYACGHCADRCCVKLFMEGQCSAVRVLLFVCECLKLFNTTGVELRNWKKKKKNFLQFCLVYIQLQFYINFIYILTDTIIDTQESDSSVGFMR